jgi:PHD/YefM family antitoxin component YafN of YafNO toxin-antitoxin module
MFLQIQTRKNNMADNLQKLIQLAKADGGKFFVIDEKGNPVLVIMGVDEYEGILLKKVQNQLEDLEEVNQKIAEAAHAEALQQNQHDEMVSEVIDSTFSFEPEQKQLEDI